MVAAQPAHGRDPPGERVRPVPCRVLSRPFEDPHGSRMPMRPPCRTSNSLSIWLWRNTETFPISAETKSRAAESGTILQIQSIAYGRR